MRQPETFQPKRLSPATNSPENALKAALGSLYPRRDLPISIYARFVKTPDKGTVLNVSMQIDGETLAVEEFGGKSRAVVDVLGIALEDRGDSLLSSKNSRSRRKWYSAKTVVSSNGPNRCRSHLVFTRCESPSEIVKAAAPAVR
jgi:hypothetical protein